MSVSNGQECCWIPYESPKSRRSLMRLGSRKIMDDHIRNRSPGIRIAGSILVLAGLAFAVYGSLFLIGWLMYHQDDPNHGAVAKLALGVVSCIIAAVLAGSGIALKPWRRDGKTSKMLP